MFLVVRKSRPPYAYSGRPNQGRILLGGPGVNIEDGSSLFIGAVDHIKDQRTVLINTTFILVGAPTGGGPGPNIP